MKNLLFLDTAAKMWSSGQANKMKMQEEIETVF